MPYNKSKTNKGFLLIEILIAIGVICVTFFMYKSLTDSTALVRNVSDEDIALKIANHKIEELRSLGYASLPVSGTFFDSLLASLPSGSAAIAISDYNSKTKNIMVTVSWVEPVTGNRSVQLATLITQTGGL
jgi:type II secretory pathway pseudopilin PulG